MESAELNSNGRDKFVSHPDRDAEVADSLAILPPVTLARATGSGT
jgi:hypothetical protein